MTYALFIDDERYPPDDSRQWAIARCLADVGNVVRQHGSPAFISFDHDLGETTASGFEIAKALVDADIDARDGAVRAELPFVFRPGFMFDVHSQNPVGAENIRRYLENYLAFLEQDETSNTDLFVLTCALWGTHVVGDAQTQASGFAADVVGDVVLGFYGSAVADMEKLVFAKDRQPKELDSGQICDSCIRALEQDGVLQRANEPQPVFGDGTRRVTEE